MVKSKGLSVLFHSMVCIQIKIGYMNQMGGLGGEGGGGGGA